MSIDAQRPPLVAILRGLPAGQANDVGAALFEAGFHMLEVPLNRPEALESIAVLAKMAPAYGLVGGGTMLTTEHVRSVHAAGGRLLVAPNFDAQVIRCGVSLGMFCAPGVATPTEAFGALKAGAGALKIFPAEMVGERGVKAMKTVLPAGVSLWPVGGITPESMAGWMDAGATGFGIGSALYTPGLSGSEVRSRAKAYVNAWRSAAQRLST